MGTASSIFCKIGNSGMTLGVKIQRKCVTKYQNVVSSLGVLIVIWLLVAMYNILPIRMTIKEYAGTSITRLQVVQPLNATLEVEGPSNNDRCVNLTSGIPQIRPVYLPDLKNPCWYGEDGQLSCLPYFYIAGLPKSGTTDLYDKVSKHPDIIRASYKEPHWITKKRFIVRNSTVYKKDIMVYTRFFKRLSTAVLSGNISAHGKITVDASASTLWYNRYWYGLRENCGLDEPKYTTAHYIKHLLPRVKIIAIMRNPTDRLYSGYMYFKNIPKSKNDFHQKAVNAIDIFNTCLATSSLRACAYNETNDIISQVRLHIGLYNVFVQDWMNLFPKEQLHFIRFEDYIKNRLAAVKKIYQFLKLRPLTPDEITLMSQDESVRNANTRKKDSVGPMRKDTRKLLDDFYRPHNENLAKLLGDKGYLWQ